MRCPYPIRIRPKIKGDGTGQFVEQHGYVPCGRCRVCRLNKAREWSVRIMDEVKHSSGSCFVTLTYNDENLPKNGTLVVEDCQKFFKRLRKGTKEIPGREFRYFLGGEYGEKGRRPHYHVIFFGLSQTDTLAIESAWGLGYVSVLPVTWDSACYVARYTEKKLYGDAAVDYAGRGVIPEFGLMSIGIGKAYVEKNRDWVKRNGFVVVEGKKVALPRYYANKIYVTDEDKMLLREKKQQLVNEAEEEAKKKSGMEGVSDVRWYQYHERIQSETNLKIRQSLKRRKL